MDPSLIDTTLDSRAVTFENPSGDRGSGGSALGGRKGAPSRRIEPDEKIVLGDIEGPGTLRHWWMTFPQSPPEVTRAMWTEVFYDGSSDPSISVPCLDFFGLPHGRPVAYASALTSCQEGRGFNTYVPMPFRQRVRVELTNGSNRPLELYYQIDYTLGPPPDRAGYLHASFRRENPTEIRRDFVISQGLRGPGRFLGCVVGIRVLDYGTWYGEGEVKVFRDGDRELPTICGTGLEDYVGSAWGMGPHHAPYAGSPLEVRRPTRRPQPDFVSFYRWHLPDPIVFTSELRVTIQQIGAAFFQAGREDDFDRYAATHPAAGRGWSRNPHPALVATGIAERADDYCACDFVYCRDAQPVPHLDLAAALADIERLAYEQPHPMERAFGT